ncbi:MAG: CRISPR-associated endoribonuclease Cas6 [Clostridia bacterium]|nr:CRISPR-associated endoribonuclease Cas6 [Clostridia bacterium]
MQIQIEFSLKQPLTLPMAYQYQLQSALYRKLSEGGEPGWHDGGFSADERRTFKAFCFGSLHGPYEVRDRSFLCFTDRLWLEFRSPLFACCDALQRSLELSPCLRLFDTSLEVTGARLLNRHILTDSVRFSAETPIVVSRRLHDGKTEYFSPEEERFFNGICDNYAEKYAAIAGDDAPELLLRPGGGFRKTVTRYKGIWVTGWRGDIVVKAPPAALELLYNAGLGEKNAQGFGFVNIKD